MAVTPNDAFKIASDMSDDIIDSEIKKVNEVKEVNSYELDDYDSSNKKTDSKVVSQAKVRKMSTSSKIKESVFKSTFKDIGKYALFDIVIPAIKNTFRDLVVNTIDMSLYGETRSKSRSRDSDRGRGSSYHSRYDEERYIESGRRERTKDISSHYWDSRAKVSDLLDDMIDYAERYDGYISLAQYNVKAGVDGDYTDGNYGWSLRELRNARPYQDRYGDWHLDINPAHYIK